MMSSPPTGDRWDVVIGLGGNLGSEADITSRFRVAIDEISRYLDAPARVSGLYRSDPVGPVADQPAFVNAVACFETPSPRPSGLMRLLLRLETEAGRRRDPALAKGPRTLDLDILLVGDARIHEPGPPALVVPHPAILHRRFVLEPLGELYPRAYVIPGTDTAIGAALACAAVATQDVHRMGDDSWYVD